MIGKMENGERKIMKRKMQLLVDKELLEELYWGRGLSVKQIGSLIGVSHTAVHKWMQKLCIGLRHPGPKRNIPNLTQSKNLAYVAGVCSEMVM